ncbi:MAG: T9SS type A sorting domain-containing protein [Candidatus Stahlbacteria bacterium]|nr:T9SS type A sorting domain-containing protein [Candidatus Stahlbacteria bacterium]
MWYILLSVMFGGISRQTDWMAGPGILGPVSAWKTDYNTSSNVTVATAGQVSLIATSWDYNAWVEHMIESNSGIWHHTQGLLPVDMDKDGIPDLVGYSAGQVVWYKHDGYYNFFKNIIGNADEGSAGYRASCVYPIDLDGDGDIDVLVATPVIGVGWFENLGLPNWGWHAIQSGAFHRISGADIDLDGDIDIIAADNSDYAYCGTIYIFKNDGSQVFTPSQTIDPGTNQGWRVYTADFNNDGYPDLYSSLYEAYVYLNDGISNPGNFTLGWHQDFWSGNVDWDGAFPVDIDMDGDADLVLASYNDAAGWRFYALLNNGTGTSFTLRDLGCGSQSYTDGSITKDIDLDGFPDIVGGAGKVAWFRQNPASPLTFTEYWIDDLAGSYYSHWVYAAPMCKCTPAIDILATEWQVGHKIYENNMLLTFASPGPLEASILEITPPELEACDLLWFGYIACVPEDTSVGFYWRSGGLGSPTDILTEPWNGPYYAYPGVNVIDSFPLSNTAARTFQYKVELRKAPDDIPVLYEVWVTYTCSGVGVEESQIKSIDNIALQFVDNKLLLLLGKEEQIKLTIYDVAGRIVKEVFDGYLPSGTHEFGIPNKHGIYFAKAESNRSKETLKFINLR